MKENKKDWFKIFCFFWAISLSVVIASMMIGHTFNLPLPLADKILSLSSKTQGWKVIHILSTECQCSKFVLEHLKQRGALPDWNEIVVLVDESSDKKLTFELKAAGFSVNQKNPSELDHKYGIDSVPWMVVVNSQGDIKYTGGYNKERVRSVASVQDIDILNSVKFNKEIKINPSFGCATSDSLKKNFDPLGIKKFFGTFLQ